jgi:hypothetical protein
MDFKDVRSKYKEHEGKFNLPNFEKINNDFEVDKIERDSEAFLRAVRKVMMEKIVNSMSFVDMLLNPVNAPRMYYSYIKNMSLQDKEDIEKIYSVLADLSVASLALEIDTGDEKEAKLIKETYEKWSEIKPLFRKVIGHMMEPLENNTKKEKSYFG